MTGLKKLKGIFTNLQNLSLTWTKEENIITLRNS